MSGHPATGALLDRWRAALMDNYGTPSVALVRGEGAVVWDDAGTPYVDLYAGIAVTALGHGHPAVVEAVSTQVATLGHVSNFFATVPAVTLAERLLALAGRDGRVYLCNSGAEANEA
ncbi:MAG TPA: aminotransferase class III-fold pyridoxal phosphate-dependent enzyme, partial [Kribbellaceae bacterium]